MFLSLFILPHPLVLKLCYYLPLPSPQPHLSCVPKSPKRKTKNKLHIVFTPAQSTDLIGGTSASSSIYKLCIVATHFIFYFQSTVHRGMLKPYLCDGDVSSLTWGPFTLSLQHGHTSSLISRRCSGIAVIIWESIQIYNTVSFVATYQHQPHLFNSDLEGEVSGWVEVLMIQFSSHWI